MSVTTLWLLRHGGAGPPGTLHGHADVALTLEGRRQAEAAARALEGLSVTALYASDLARARDTAAPIAARLGLTAECLPALRERRFGAWEGREVAALAREAPEALAGLWGDPAFAPPGGESFAGLAARVLPAVDAILARHPGQSVAVVAHGGSLRAVLGRILGLGPPGLLRLALDHGHAAVARVFADGGAEVAALNLPPAAWSHAVPVSAAVAREGPERT
jgi:broad specificity phosphatase PhoE